MNAIPELPRAMAALGVPNDLHVRAALASSSSFVISDPNLPDDPLIWVNPAFEQVSGYEAAEVLGRNCRFLQGPGTDRGTVDRIRAALARGETAADTLLNYRKDGTPFWNQVVVSPVRDAAGTVTHRVGIQVDVTEQVEAGRARDASLAQERDASARLRLLAEVSNVLAQHRDYSAAVRALAELAVPRLADWGFVGVTSDRGRFEQLHVVAVDPDAAAAAQGLAVDDLSWLTRSPRVREALRSTAMSVAQPFPIDLDGLPERTTPHQLAHLTRLGLGSAVVVPLWARDRVIGVLCLVHGDRDGFTAETVVTAAHVGHRAGLGLDNLRLYLRERDATLTLQHSLLPQIPHVPGLDIAATYLPAQNREEVGGDWFDVLSLPDGAVGLAVGDVVGHDLRAAASMGQLRSVLRSYAWSGEPASRVLAHLDQLVRGLEVADIATCVYLRLEAGELRYARAGHPPPLLLLPDGRVESLDGGLTTPVGVASPDLGADAEPEGTCAMPEGAVLVLYTDGLVERRDRPLKSGIDALTTALRAVPRGLPVEQIRDLLVQELVTQDHEDDVCLLVVRRLPLGEG